MLQLLHSAVCQELDAKVAAPQFAARVKTDKYTHKKDAFIGSIKEESALQVAVYEGKAGKWFANNTQLGKAVADSLALPGLARSKLNLWMHDPSLTLEDAAFNLNFQTARRRDGLRAMKRRENMLADAEAAGEPNALAALAAEDCVAKHYMDDEASLERPDELSGQMPLMTQSFLGDAAAVKRLLQARANPNAAVTQEKVC